MASESGRHSRCSLPPFLFKPMGMVSDFFSQTHMGSRNIIKGLKKTGLLLEMRTFFAEAQGLANQRGQGLSERQIEAFQEGGTDGQSQFGESFCATEDARRDLRDPSFALLFHDLAVDQVRMRLFDRLLRASRFAGPMKGLVG